MPKLWRLHTNTDSEGLIKIGDYCLEHGVLAMGWSLKDAHLEGLSPEDRKDVIRKRSEISSFGDYSALISEYGIYGGEVNGNVRRLATGLATDDLVWIRQKGVYYYGRVTEESRWHYDCSDEALALDASNQLTNIDWQPVGDESRVPGAVSNAMIHGKTLQQIHDRGALAFTMASYNSRVFRRHYELEQPRTAEAFYSLLSNDDCEDLLCLWLYSKFGYICIPSTNKRSTELYECVLRDPESGRSIFPQVKNGYVDINADEYTDLKGEVWLLSTKGKVIGSERENIHIADPEELFAFAMSPEASSLLPESIYLWAQVLKDGGCYR